MDTIRTRFRVTRGQYTEVQAGRLFNQAAPESSLTLFKNREFTASSTDEFTEYWFPVKQTKGLRWTCPEGSLNLQNVNGKGLASVHTCRGDFENALSYAEKSLISNTLSSEAIHLKILASRKLGREKKISEEIAKLLN